MSQTSLEALDIARRWIGTPYRHQASAQGCGTDCLGLLRGIWRGLYGGEPGPVPAYTQDWSEASGVEALFEAAQHHLIPEDTPQIGQVILFRMKPGAVAKHLGVQSSLTPHARFIHAYSGHGVVENSLTPPWERRIVGRFSFPERT